MKTLIILCVAILIADARLVRRSAAREYKMCVPEDLMPQCEEMILQKTKAAAKIICIPARDRIECIDKIKKHLADFGTVDPEDMYVASKVSDNDFTVFEEIRTLEEPEAEFRYEGVAVIHKDLDINSVEGLKGLKSCHTGVGRNVGYKIPLTKLKNMGLIGNLNDPNLSPRENELDALSKLFSKACIVGDWSPDKNIDKKMKKRFPNLCALCEEPEKCDYPDKFSGYEGALRCLAHNGGQIAWTKVIYVRKFFGLPVGITPGGPSPENPENYAYFCPDGSKVPVTGVPCRWAARPWQGYIASGAVIKNIDELRRKIENLNAEGSKTHAQWLEKLLEISEDDVPKESKIISTKDYLDKANYTDVIERDYGPPYKTVKFCVHNEDALAKCRDLSEAAFSRDVRPRFDCVLESDCMKTIQDNGADVISIPPEKVNLAIEKYNLKPIVIEESPNKNYAVAVVKKSSAIKSFEDLKGAKSCHTGNQLVGFYAPFNALKKLNLLTKPSDCSAADALAGFFSQGCLAKSHQGFKISPQGEEALCGLCEDVKGCTNGANTCLDALKCLDTKGDVAFVKSGSLSRLTEQAKENYELLCPNGGRAPLSNVADCHLLTSQVPPNMIVTSNSKSNDVIDGIASALLSASELFTERPDWFKMFGPYNGKHNVLFKDSTTSLKNIGNVVFHFTKDFKEDLSNVENYCD